LITAAGEFWLARTVDVGVGCGRGDAVGTGVDVLGSDVDLQANRTNPIQKTILSDFMCNIACSFALPFLHFIYPLVSL
jgi:hypothetical protein